VRRLQSESYRNVQQLVFDLAEPEPPSFGNFLPGRNAEVVAAMRSAAAGTGIDTGLLVWGPPGAGKTHLLRATIAAALAQGLSAAWFAGPGGLSGVDPDELGAKALIAVDDVGTADAAAQARLFTIFNELKRRGGHLVVASDAAPASLSLRDDLRTPLGWGLVFELHPLTDDDKPAALLAYARQRGFALSDEVIRYLLAHGRRDMTALLATLAALDRHSLAAKRPITVPLLRQWLQREIGFDP
jgi:DnaA family protein